MSTHHLCSWCPWKPQEALDLELQFDCATSITWVLGIEPASERAASALTAELSPCSVTCAHSGHGYGEIPTSSYAVLLAPLSPFSSAHSSDVLLKAVPEPPFLSLSRIIYPVHPWGLSCLTLASKYILTITTLLGKATLLPFFLK